MPKTQSLSIDLLRTDADTQSRLAISEDAVEDYAELIALSNGTWPFPPLDVFHDGSEHFVADGFHRALAAQRAKRASIPCIVHKGTAKDARIFAMTANDKHGLRLSRKERRANVHWLLDHCPKMTQKAIAEAAGVTPRTVKIIAADRNPEAIKTPPCGDGKGKISPCTPDRGGSDPFDEIDDPFADPFEAPESPQTASIGKGAPDSGKAGNTQQAGNGKPPKQFDAMYWFKQWEQAIGPVARLVDRIADNVGPGTWRKRVQSDLETATQDMMKGLKVKK